eukprot:8298396-Lingulodinium_polyedra.AAC.1
MCASTQRPRCPPAKKQVVPAQLFAAPSSLRSRGRLGSVCPFGVREPSDAFGVARDSAGMAAT